MASSTAPSLPGRQDLSLTRQESKQGGENKGTIRNVTKGSYRLAAHKEDKLDVIALA